MVRHIKVDELRYVKNSHGLCQDIAPRDFAVLQVPARATAEATAKAAADVLRENGFVFHGSVPVNSPYLAWERPEPGTGRFVQKRAALVGFTNAELALVHDEMLQGPPLLDGEGGR